MKDNLTAFERRIELLFLLTKCRETTATKLSYYFSVSKDTIFRDIDFLNRYAPIYTKRGMFGGIFINDESRNSLLLYLSYEEERVLTEIMETLETPERNIVRNVINKFSMPKTAT